MEVKKRILEMDSGLNTPPTNSEKELMGANKSFRAMISNILRELSTVQNQQNYLDSFLAEQIMNLFDCLTV